MTVGIETLCGVGGPLHKDPFPNGRRHWFVRWLVLLGLWATLCLGTPAGAAIDASAPWPIPADGLLAHDPAVVWGRLPNGLRYAVMPGGTPADRVSLRLMVEAGSLMESEQQRGLAHFLEHMAFEGSQNLAPGE